MNMRFLFVLLVISHFSVRLFAGGGVSSDTRSSKEAVVIPTTESIGATNLAGVIKNREQSYLLAVKAAETPGLPNIVRFSACASACEGYWGYLSGVRYGPSSDRDCFTNSSLASNVVHLLDISLMLLREPLPPRLVLDPLPHAADGSFVGGMDPQNIADPESRAKYERFLTANRLRIDESNSRAKLEQEVDNLENFIVPLIPVLNSEGKSAAIKSAISSSQLPAEIKDKLLGK
jgi:hypothetical protein